MLKYDDILTHKYKINRKTAKLPDETIDKIMKIVERLRIYNANDSFMIQTKHHSTNKFEKTRGICLPS